MLDNTSKAHAPFYSVVFPGKILGVFLFEPLVSRFGYKPAMYVVAVMQSIGLIGKLVVAVAKTSH